MTASVGPSDRSLARTVARWGAILLFLALLTGGYAAFGLSGQLPVDGRMALAAHTTALTGSFWIFAIAYTLPMLRLGTPGKRRLAITLIAAQYANWIVGTGKAAWAVHGIARTGDPHNDLVFVVLNITVVVPTLIGAAIWIWAFFGAAPDEAI